MNFKYRFLIAASVVAFSRVATAQVAFNDFISDSDSPTFGYNIGSGWTVTGAGNANGEFEAANQFTAGANGTLADVILAISYVEGDDSVQVQLVNDNGNTVGSTVLESWTTSSNGSFGSWSTPTTLLGDGSASLTSGTNYWLVLSAVNVANSTMWDVWNLNGTPTSGQSGTDAYNQGSGWNYQPGSTLGAFEVDVTPAPEPASVIALGGAMALIIRKRRAAK